MNVAAPKPVPSMSVAEFLEWDDGTDTRYELVDGQPVAMTPPTPIHGELVIAMGAALRSRLGPPCRVIGEAGIRLIDRSDSYYAADLAVTCSPRAPDRQWVTDPVVVIEVLSPSTTAHDRGRKGYDYRLLPSVQEVVFVFSSAVRAELWRREGKLWRIEDLVGSEAIVRLPSLNVEVPLAEVYGDIELAPDKPTGSGAQSRGGSVEGAS